ncbi:DUF721 domain-containing protein [Microscilla marina]|uniref:DUF721 domain-containing protein n=1 Tax=Microscilla marina ATCC 23134 TaxID=313606 RepID=A1ZXC7_MICM2|nr:DUF721 domain-containing protein [Microscilla marina]EAY25001.1 conserved hypothetical protein [Microscilla marina ATCC 23134]
MSDYLFRNHKNQPRKASTTTMKDAVYELLNNYKIKNKYDEAHIIQVWGDLMGEEVACRTEWVYIKNHTIFIKISSPPLRTELLMRKTNILDRINHNLGEEKLQEIVFR